MSRKLLSPRLDALDLYKIIAAKYKRKMAAKLVLSDNRSETKSLEQPRDERQSISIFYITTP